VLTESLAPVQQQPHPSTSFAPAGSIRESVSPLRRALTSKRSRFVAFSVVDQIFVSGSNVLLNILLARWLAKSDFGAFAVLFSIFTLISGFHNALLIEPMSVLGGGLFRRSLGVYNGHSLRLHGLICLLFVPVSVIAGFALVSAGQSPIALAGSLFAGVALVPLYMLLRRAAYVAREYGTAALAGVLYIGSVMLAMYAMREILFLSWKTAFAAQAIGAVLGAGILRLRLARSSIADNEDLHLRTVLREHWKYGRWAISTTIVFWLSAEAYSIIIGLLLGASEVAGFRAVLNISMLLPNFVIALSVLVLPRAAARFDQRASAGVHRLVISFVALSCAVAIGYGACLLVGGEALLGLLYGHQYRALAPILPVLVCNLLLITISQGFQMGLRAMNAPREIFLGFATAGLCTCTVGLAATLVWGVRGAGIGLCLSSLSLFTVVACRYIVVARRANRVA